MMPEPSVASRKPRTLVVVLVVVGVLVVCIAVAVVAGLSLFLPVRQEITEVPQPDVTTEEAEPGTPAEDMSPIEAEAETVSFSVLTSSAGWAGHITGIETTTVLRRPIIVVSTDIGPEQADVSDEVVAALTSFASGLTADDGSHYSFYFQVLSSDGDLIGTSGSTDDRWRLDVPAAPKDPAGVREWLETVYGSGSPRPEAWVERITAIGEPAADPDGNIVVRTDLDPAAADDRRAAQTIIDAVNSSGASFAPGIRVVFNDGVFEWSSLLDGVDPFAP